MSNSTKITIRPATAGDVGAISTILRELGWFNHINKESPDDTKACIAQHLELYNSDESHTVLVAENQNGEVIGYIAVHWIAYLMLAGSEGYISELFVCESDRGRGVGRKLLEVVNEQAIKRGCTRFMLVNGRNRESYKRGFYQKLGWKERQEVSNFVLLLPKKI